MNRPRRRFHVNQETILAAIVLSLAVPSASAFADDGECRQRRDHAQHGFFHDRRSERMSNPSTAVLRERA
jgi:hypothetical protein